MIHSGTHTNMQISWLAARSSVSRTSLLKCVILFWQQERPSPQTERENLLPSMYFTWGPLTFPNTEHLINTSNSFLAETHRRTDRTLQ